VRRSFILAAIMHVALLVVAASLTFGWPTATVMLLR
jgi:uncharacterized membrane protein SpoIIM required for sporulation